MRYIAGIDIGNSSTEVALARLDEAGALTITGSALAETTGIKGTLRNVFGIQEALTLAAKTQASMSAIFRLSASTKPHRSLAMSRWKPSRKPSLPSPQ